MGLKFHYNALVGRPPAIQGLEEGHGIKAVFHWPRRGIFSDEGASGQEPRGGCNPNLLARTSPMRSRFFRGMAAQLLSALSVLFARGGILEGAAVSSATCDGRATARSIHDFLSKKPFTAGDLTGVGYGSVRFSSG